METPGLARNPWPKLVRSGSGQVSLHLPRETEVRGQIALSLVRIAPGHLQGSDGDSKAWRERSEQSILQGVVTSS